MPTALLSLSNKRGLLELGGGLTESGWELLASGEQLRTAGGSDCKASFSVRDRLCRYPGGCLAPCTGFRPGVCIWGCNCLKPEPGGKFWGGIG